MFALTLGIFLVYCFYYYMGDNPRSISSRTNTNTVTAATTKDFTMDVLQAMHYYYFSTQGQTAEGEDSITVLVNMMSSTMDSIQRLESGNAVMATHLESTNEPMNLIAKSMTTGSNIVILTENNFINYLKDIDATDVNSFGDVEYQLAKRNSGEKEGYTMITLAATQVGYLFFDPAESDNPSGPIPYKITKQERESILKEIDRLFGEELKEYEGTTDDVNTIIFGVDSIKNMLLPDTYEEADELES